MIAFRIPYGEGDARNVSRNSGDGIEKGAMRTGSLSKRPRAPLRNADEPLRRAAIAAFVLAALCVPACAADAFSTDWAHGAKSEARLIGGSATLAGFEIRLAPGAITYWRDPGDAGLPPTFDFSASDNVASVEPEFPAPKRMHEADGAEAFGYDANVIFPLRVKPRDATKPVTLALQADYAVCEKVCLPAKASLKLTLPAGADSPYAAAIDAALAAVPRVVSPNDFGELESDGADAFRLCAPHEEGPPRDLFVEPPHGWWATAAREPGESGRDCFSLRLQDKPKDAALPVALRLTLTGGAGAVETTIAAGAQ
jgi:DsbC/DsbD-like thiol-disulfide interchange protein